MTTFQTLIDAGLTQTEGKIYLVLLEQGSSLASAVTKKSGLHRRTVYDALERLIEKGVVSYIKRNNRMYFEAQNPKRLLEILREKEERIEKSLADLEKLYLLPKEKEETLFFRGKEGLKTIFDEQIDLGQEILILGASTNAKEIVKFYFPRYDMLRKRKKIPIKAIFSDKIREKIPLAQIKYLPKEQAGHMALNIYGNNVAIILWIENPYAILIRSKDIADSYRKHFEIMWGIAKE